MSNTFQAAARAVRERAAVVAHWLEAFSASRLRVPGSLPTPELAGWAAGIVDGLSSALPEPGCAPGAQVLREAEKRIAFAGGGLEQLGATAFDVMAFTTALRDVLQAGATGDERDALARLFDWFCALALEGYATARRDALRLRYRDSLERGTPVFMVTRELPATFLIGEPDRGVLEATFGRLVLAIVRVGAKAVIVDGGGLTSATDPAVLDAVSTFAAHRKVLQVTTFVCGLPAEAEDEWRRHFPDASSTHKGAQIIERFDDALPRALALTGQHITQPKS
jgi:hypothetical protein